MLVKQRNKPAQRRLLGAVQPDCREVLGVTDPLRLFQLDRARHGPRLRLTRFSAARLRLAPRRGKHFVSFPRRDGGRWSNRYAPPAALIGGSREIFAAFARSRPNAELPRNARKTPTSGGPPHALNISASNLGFNPAVR